MAVTGACEGRALRLAVSGEVDHHRAGELMSDIDRYIDTCLPSRLTLDLSGVTFMDSSGIAIVLRCYRRLGDLGGALAIQGVPPQAAKVLRTAGLGRLIPFED